MSNYLKSDIFNSLLAAGFTTKNRHDSFAPVRFNQNGQWFVDGESHMSAVADAIELVKIILNSHLIVYGNIKYFFWQLKAGKKR